jgi:hypothetical protein
MGTTPQCHQCSRRNQEFEQRYKKKVRPTKQETQSARLQAERNIEEMDEVE